ncbi:helix-turn-helix domain-containing protein [Amycolatopsis cihanbeyliensis]|uniref:Helix-turn-helix protein n=1 Tax=Amycolatopsis cihanbeyliensis TaxID=1128664 RepID=A0A542DPR5_AMYCI|nr:helix-turn-helix transcriptional regulator [Amycolatopsis cihanbeyliensis]TQJ05082.1 helix-turn-helix protein [Amycolatopsis cihanbeyliensis]
MVAKRYALAARREALGFTQEALAQQLGTELSTVGRWERGTLTPQPWRRPDLATALQVSLTELDELLNPLRKHDTSKVSSASESDGPSPAAPVPARPSGPPTRLSEPSTEHLDEFLTYFRDQWHALVRTDNLLGPRFALTAVHGHLTVIEDLLPAAAGWQRLELVKLAATYAESLAWLHEDAGQQHAATHWVGRAMEWAHEAGDDLLLAWTLFRRSQHAAAEGDAQRTIGLAQAAGRGRDRLPGPMRAAIAQQEAVGYALAGDEFRSHHTVDLAHQWAVRDSAGTALGGHGSFCSETYLELQRAHCWTALGKPQQALRVYESALPALPPVYRRDRGVACSRLAQAHLAAGQPDEAAQAGREALAIARSSGSMRTEQAVALVGRRLTRHRHLRSVEQLLEELVPATSA